MSDDEKSVGAAVGRVIREIRLGEGASQDHLARAARECGLGWTRTVVAALEEGRRDEVSLGEALLLPLVLTVAFPEAERVSFPEIAERVARNESMIRLSRDAVVSAGIVPGIVSGKGFDLQNWMAEMPLTRGSMKHVEEAFRRVDPHRHLWPRATFAELERAELASHGVFEQKVAQRLGASPIAVSVAAYRHWGRSLTEERDARVEVEPGASSRSRQGARGHVTRHLLPEIEAAMKRFESDDQLDREVATELQEEHHGPRS